MIRRDEPLIRTSHSSSSSYLPLHRQCTAMHGLPSSSATPHRTLQCTLAPTQRSRNQPAWNAPTCGSRRSRARPNRHISTERSSSAPGSSLSDSVIITRSHLIPAALSLCCAWSSKFECRPGTSTDSARHQVVTLCRSYATTLGCVRPPKGTPSEENVLRTADIGMCPESHAECFDVNDDSGPELGHTVIHGPCLQRLAHSPSPTLYTP
ncbi:hypothetical protein C8Q74DRAFT_495736 [Fomes fomentarius]|nr:hypothetical protein C8Q74DRAFT_495736 [Fomes fomentarius]